MNRSILDILTEYTLNERIDTLLLNNPEFVEMQHNIDKLMEQIEGDHLEKGQYEVIENLVAACVTQGNVYAKIAYRQGMMDLTSFLKEIMNGDKGL